GLFLCVVNGAIVRVGFWGKDDPGCTAGNHVFFIDFDTNVTCYAWVSFYLIFMPSENIKMHCGTSINTYTDGTENSPNGMHCYSDRLRYTKYPESSSCSKVKYEIAKEMTKTDCVPDSGLYGQILSGNENCPASPAGFKCPVSSDATRRFWSALIPLIVVLL